jgi:RHS repeat-associated protein
LPFTSNWTGQSPLASPKNEQKTFYTSLYGASDGASAYADLLLEDSPLGRSLGEKAPGVDFKTHHTTISYRTNAASEVRQLETEKKFYDANSLLVKVEIDADGRERREFISKSGRKVRSDVGSAMTYFTYDALGNVTHIVPPKAAKLTHDNVDLTVTSPSIANNSFVYTYSPSTNLKSSSRLPGHKANTNYFHDRLDRLVMVRDAENVQVFTKYDILGRPILTGTYSGTSVPSSSDQLYESKTTNNTFNYTTASSFPRNNIEVHSATHYDNYDFEGDGSSYSRKEQLVNGLVTKTKSVIFNEDGNVIANAVQEAFTFYDKKGQVVNTKLLHTLGGQDVYTYGYDFTGNLINSSRTYTKSGGGGTSNRLSVNKKYTYDHRNRLLEVTQQLNDGAWTRLVNNTYNELGQLARKGIGGELVTDQFTLALQTVDYEYNIRGWLQSINDLDFAGRSASPNSDLFSTRLNYNTNPTHYNALRQYGGNISSVEWRIYGDNSCIASYPMTYDDQNRLKNATYREKNAFGSTRNYLRYSVDNIDYDLNGNIKAIKRRGRKASGSYGIIDDLSMTYNSTIYDRMQSVTESADGNSGYTGPTGVPQEYTYDGHGSVTSDDSKDITSISTNYFNLPRRIEVDHTPAVGFRYAGTGQKISQTDERTGVQREYINGLELQNGAFASLQHEAGRAVYENGEWVNEYVLQDHLQNTRVIFRKSTTGGSGLDVQATFSYYPFGMEIENLGTGGSDIAYRYNGKELNPDLNLYDYGARWYDHAVGRFLSIDPLADQMPDWSPYSYTFNNPISYTDPTGMYPELTREDYDMGRARLLTCDGCGLLSDPGNSGLKALVQNSEQINLLQYDLQALTDDKIAIRRDGKVEITDYRPLENHQAGGALLRSIINNKETLTTIRYNQDRSYSQPVDINGNFLAEDDMVRGTKYNTALYYAFKQNQRIMNIDGTRGGIPAYITLGHEIYHSDSRMRGDFPTGSFKAFDFDNMKILRFQYSELRTRLFENTLRSENNVKLRAFPIPIILKNVR